MLIWKVNLYEFFLYLLLLRWKFMSFLFLLYSYLYINTSKIFVVVLNRLFMLARKDHTLISPTSWLTFSILSVIFVRTFSVTIHSYLFGHDPLIVTHLLLRLVCTLSVKTHSHSFGNKSFTPFRLRSVHTLFWSGPVYTFSVTTYSHPFDHNHLHHLVTTCL